MGEGFGYAVEQAAFKKGYEEQMIRSIISLTKTLDLSVKQAMDVLEISEEQQCRNITLSSLRNRQAKKVENSSIC